MIESAVDLQNRGQFRAAIHIYDLLIQHHRSGALYNERGILHIKCKDFAKAIVDFTDAIAIDAGDPDPFVNRGNAYFWSGAYGLAIDDYDVALGLSPADKHALNNRAQARAEQGEICDAISDFQSSIALDESYTSPLYNLGKLLLHQGDYPQALSFLDRAVELDPGNPAFLCTRGDVLRCQERDELAYSDYCRAALYNPRDFRPFCRLASLHCTSSVGFLRNGKQALQQALFCCQMTSFQYSDCLESLAAAYAELGDFESAIQWQSKAVSLAEQGKSYEKAHTKLLLYQKPQGHSIS